MFKNFSIKTAKPNFVYDEAVILNIDFEGIDEFGTQQQRNAIGALERDIIKLLPQNSGIDGNEFGDGECIIYIYGPSADKIFEFIHPPQYHGRQAVDEAPSLSSLVE